MRPRIVVSAVTTVAFMAFCFPTPHHYGKRSDAFEVVRYARTAADSAFTVTMSREEFEALKANPPVGYVFEVVPDPTGIRP